MRPSGVTVTGLAETRRDVDRLPSVVVARLRAVAGRTAHEIQQRAQSILRSKTHGTGKTADSIVVVEESEKKQFTVRVDGNPDRPAPLPEWIERGSGASNRAA